MVASPTPGDLTYTFSVPLTSSNSHKGSPESIRLLTVIVCRMAVERLSKKSLVDYSQAAFGFPFTETCVSK